jgi:transposase-like protein
MCTLEGELDIKASHKVTGLQKIECTMPGSQKSKDTKVRIVNLRQQGLSFREIGVQLGLHHSTASHWYQ